MSTASQDLSGVEQAGAKLLVVDDDLRVVETTAGTLRRAGYEVVTTTNAGQCLELCRRERPDLVLLDVVLGDADGRDLCRRIKEDEGLADTFVILISGMATSSDSQADGLDALADAYLTRPLPARELLAHVRTAARLQATQKALRRSERTYRLLADNTLDVIWSMDMDRRFTYVNPAVEDMFGYTPAEFVGTRLDDHCDHEHLDRMREIIGDELAHLANHRGVIFETILLHKDGREVDAEVHGSFLRDESGRPAGMQGTTRDITDRKRSERLIEELARFPAENPYPVLRIGPQGEVLHANPAAIGLLSDLGCNVGGPAPADWREAARRAIQDVAVVRWEHARGETVHALHFVPVAQGRYVNVYGVDITDRKRAERALVESEQRFRGLFERMPSGVAVYQAEGDGHNFVFKDLNRAAECMEGVRRQDVIGRRITDAFPGMEDFGLLDALRRVWRTGRAEFLPASLYRDRRDPGSWREVWVYKLPSGDVVSLYNNVTQRIEAEKDRKDLEEQIRRAQRLEAVGRLAGGVAHDFNNMLSVIIGNAELARGKLDAGKQVTGHLDEIRKASERSADLTRQLLAFARKQTVAPEVLDLNETVGGMLKMLGRLIGEEIDLAWVPGADLWPVRMDPGQIDQILANLAVNARDAIEGVGTLTIETGNATIDEAYCQTHPDFAPGRYVRLTVSDSGCGMDEQTLGQVFEPFFTTKESGKGTGLGLATVYGIVRQNEGFIHVYSEPGHGTTFRIYLPRHEGRGPDAAEPDESQPLPAARGEETVLFVEDEPAMLQLGVEMLEDLGYRVLSAATPNEALDTAREYDGEIHLLVTDVVMPQMNGRDLAGRLRALYPGIARLYTSGYTANVIAHRGVLDEGVLFLQKPFAAPALAAKVRRALDGP